MAPPLSINNIFHFCFVLFCFVLTVIEVFWKNFGPFIFRPTKKKLDFFGPSNYRITFIVDFILDLIYLNSTLISFILHLTTGEPWHPSEPTRQINIPSFLDHRDICGVHNGPWSCLCSSCSPNESCRWCSCLSNQQFVLECWFDGWCIALHILQWNREEEILKNVQKDEYQFTFCH